MSEQYTTSVYEGADGERIYLTVPWGYHTGRIPPPLVKFYISQSGAELTFRYAGDDEDFVWVRRVRRDR